MISVKRRLAQLKSHRQYWYFACRHWRQMYELEHTKWIETENKRVVLAEDSRRTVREGLCMGLESLNPQTDILLIHADRASLADSGTFAQMNQFVKNICPKVKLTVFLPENVAIEHMSMDDLGKRGLMAIPSQDDMATAAGTATEVLKFQEYVAKYGKSHGSKITSDDL